MPSESLAIGLFCVDCNTEHSLAYHLNCTRCGGLLEIKYDLERLSEFASPDTSRTGVWRYAAWMPIHQPEHFISLGEQPTPLMPAPRLGAAIGIPNLWIKFEGGLPTGTVKDRSSQTATAAAKQFGFDVIGVVSTGNAAASIATYATRAGLRGAVFCYTRTTPAKMAHIVGVASDAIWYDGSYDDMISVFDKAVDKHWFFDGGATRNPYKQEGKKTVALEIFEQLGRRAPDTMVYPVGMGETLLASQRAWSALKTMSLIEHMPRPVSAQSDEANTLATAWTSGENLQPKDIGYTIAEGTAVGDMGRKGLLTLRRIREQDGAAGCVSDEEILSMQQTIAALEGLWVGPTGTVPVAVAARLAQEKVIDGNAETVCVVTETGLKGDWAPSHVEGERPSLHMIERMLKQDMSP